ncbi:sugar porter family MFS transporter [Pantoea sp. S62]|uniref:sugar porter family MFS transporter n=1 Tax=Pantoea sp. S62 TaxID=2769342 RepID=UPI001913B93C|nr:sugar porter family MFS transporter [Pantoea sp. S62]MBK5016762.1 sugar porter family MFS transporter [Pantoea sp. S62]
MKARSKHNTSYILLICGIAALGGILFGYDTAVISGAIEPLQKHFNLSAAETGWAVSNVVIGCVAGAFSAGVIAGKYGRKKALILAALLFTVSAIGTAVATTFSLFVVFRLIGGLAVGLAATVSPMYMSEVAPKDMRGRALSMQQFAIVSGQIVIFLVNYLIARDASDAWLTETGWRWMFGSGVLPCTLFCALVFIIPESPRWSVMAGRDDDALAMLTKVSNPQHAQNVLAEIKSSLRNEQAQNSSKIRFGNSTTRFILLLGCTLAVMQLITGVNVMMYYAPVVLQTVTGSAQEALFQTIWIGVFQLIGVITGAMLLDRTGRLPLMRFGTLGVIIGLLLLSYALFSGTTGYMALFGMLVFMFFYALSWGVVGWTLVSEIFPNRMRASGMSIAIGCQWAANFVVSQLFPIINDNAWLSATFNGAFPMLFFAVCAVWCYWFIGRYVPETRGVALESMEEVILARREGNPVPETAYREPEMRQE